MSHSAIVLAFFVAAALLAEATPFRRLSESTLCPESVCIAATTGNPSALLGFLSPVDRSLCDCVCDGDENTPLHLAARYNSVAVATVLLSAPFNCPADVSDDHARTPIHTAAQYCNSAMTELLIAYGAHPSTVNWDFNIPICEVGSRRLVSECAAVARAIGNLGPQHRCQERACGVDCTREGCDDFQSPVAAARSDLIRQVICQDGMCDECY